MKLRTRVLFRIAVAALVIAAVIIYWRITGLHYYFSEFVLFLEKVARKSGPAGMLAFTALAMFGAASGPFTVVPLVPSAIRAWGMPLTGAMLMTGSLLGAGLTYLIGRFAGDTVLKLFVRPKRLESWKAHIPEHSAFFTALLVKFALPAEIGYAFGVIRFGLVRYLAVTFISYIPIIAAILWASSAFVEGKLAPIIISIAFMGLIMSAAGWYLHKTQGAKWKILRFFGKR